MTDGSSRQHIDILLKLQDLQKHGPLSKYFGRQTGEEAIAEIERLRAMVIELNDRLSEATNG